MKNIYLVFPLRRLGVFAALLAICSLSIAGCGNKTEQAVTQAPTNPQAAAAAGQQAAAKEGDRAADAAEAAAVGKAAVEKQQGAAPQ